MGSTEKAKQDTGRKCPQCAKPVPPRQPEDAFPFCSKRCQLLDLGKWLDGEYAIPGDASLPMDDDES